MRLHPDAPRAASQPLFVPDLADDALDQLMTDIMDGTPPPQSPPARPVPPGPTLPAPAAHVMRDTPMAGPNPFDDSLGNVHVELREALQTVDNLVDRNHALQVSLGAMQDMIAEMMRHRAQQDAVIARLSRQQSRPRLRPYPPARRAPSPT